MFLVVFRGRLGFISFSNYALFIQRSFSEVERIACLQGFFTFGLMKLLLGILLVVLVWACGHEPLPQSPEQKREAVDRAFPEKEEQDSIEKHLKKEVDDLNEKLEARDSLIQEVMKLEIEEDL